MRKKLVSLFVIAVVSVILVIYNYRESTNYDNLLEYAVSYDSKEETFSPNHLAFFMSAEDVLREKKISQDAVTVDGDVTEIRATVRIEGLVNEVEEVYYFYKDQLRSVAYKVIVNQSDLEGVCEDLYNYAAKYMPDSALVSDGLEQIKEGKGAVWEDFNETGVSLQFLNSEERQLTLMNLGLSVDRQWSAITTKEFRLEEGFQYDSIKPGMSFAEVDHHFWKDLKEDTDESFGERNVTCYKSGEVFRLNEQRASAHFMFEEDKLQALRLKVRLDRDYEEWFRIQTEELIRLFGEARGTMENTSEVPCTRTILWEAGDTQLVLKLFYGEGISPFAEIGIAYKDAGTEKF